MRVNPIDADEIIENLPKSNHVFIVEETAGNCGIHEHVACLLRSRKTTLSVKGFDLGNRYIPHGSVEKLYDFCGLSPEKMAVTIQEVLQNEN